MKKTCFRCGKEKSLDEFYPHPKMKDGFLNKCKECAKQDVKENYQDKRLQYSEYEKRRNQTLQRRSLKRLYEKNHRRKHPEKEKARKLVWRAIRNGRLKKLPCAVCGNRRVQAHHQDYGKALEVLWLCFKHHREIGHNQVVSKGDYSL